MYFLLIFNIRFSQKYFPKTLLTDEFHNQVQKPLPSGIQIGIASEHSEHLYREVAMPDLPAGLICEVCFKGSCKLDIFIFELLKAI